MQASARRHLLPGESGATASSSAPTTSRTSHDRGIRADRYCLRGIRSDQGGVSRSRGADQGVEENERYRAALGDDPAEIGEVRAGVRDLAVQGGFAERA